MTDLVLRIEEPECPAREFPVGEGTTIGRHPENGCVLEDAKVSGYHARIFKREDSSYVIEDCGSSNHTRVLDGPELQQGEQYVIAPGTRIKLGLTLIHVSSSSPVSKTKALHVVALESPVPTPSAPPPPAKDDDSRISESSEAPTPSVAIPVVEVDSESESSGKKTTAHRIVPAELGTHGKGQTTVKGPLMPSRVAPEGADAEPVESALPDVPLSSTNEDDERDNLTTVVSRPRSAEIEGSAGDLTDRSRTPGLSRDDLREQHSASAKTISRPATGTNDELTEHVARPDFDAMSDEATVFSGRGPSPTDGQSPAGRGSRDDGWGNGPNPEAQTVAGPQTDPELPTDLAGGTEPGSPPGQSDQHPAAHGDSTVSVPISRPDAGRGGSLEEEAALEDMAPRLVFVTPDFRRTVQITAVNFSIGRKRSSIPTDVDCSLDHPTVSSKHAAIKFNLRRFFVEDNGSKNGTFVNGRPLPIMAEREIGTEAHVKFGVVDVLFIVDLDTDLQPLDRSSHVGAADFLVRRRVIKSKQRDAAVRSSQSEGRHIGEYLLLAGLISVENWIEALRSVANEKAAKKNAGRSTVVVWRFVVALLILGTCAAGLVYWKMRGGF